MARERFDWDACIADLREFLHAEYGLEPLEHMEPDIFDGVHGEVFQSDTLQVSIASELGSRYFLVTTEVELLQPGSHGLGANLPLLVEAAVFAPHHKVLQIAHGAEGVAAAVENHLMWLRRILPLITGPGGPELIRLAYDKSVNPKRRAPNIRWKYA